MLAHLLLHSYTVVRPTDAHRALLGAIRIQLLRCGHSTASTVVVTDTPMGKCAVCYSREGMREFELGLLCN